jgi:hypothetical protein
VYDAYAIDGLDLFESELAGTDEDLAEFEALMGRSSGRMRVRRHRRRRHRPGSPRRRGYRNIDLLDDDDALMSFMGINEDDLDFVDSLGGSMMAYGAYGEEGDGPGKRLRSFFSEKIPALVEKFKQKATVARVRAEQLENKAEQAVLKAQELRARAAAGQPVSEAVQRTFPSPPAKTLTTPQVVGVVALALAGGYLIAKKF